MIKVNEIFFSIQGESSFMGLPCVFVRLTYCNLRCSYCDTEYAFYDGNDYTIDQIVSEVNNYNSNLVEISGGEPLLQKECYELMTKLCDLSYTVLLETSGSILIKDVDKRVKVIMDLKTPSSKMENKNVLENIELLKKDDEVKFVIGSRDDYNWAKDVIIKYNLNERVKEILMGCVFGIIEPIELANWILKDNLKVRFQMQLHKYIWHPNTRGV